MRPLTLAPALCVLLLAFAPAKCMNPNFVYHCSREVLVRHVFATRFKEFPGIGGSPLGPALIRMAFHDALDFENTADGTGALRPGEGGVDFCLLSSLNVVGADEATKQDPSHNRGLRTAYYAHWMPSTTKPPVPPPISPTRWLLALWSR